MIKNENCRVALAQTPPSLSLSADGVPDHRSELNLAKPKVGIYEINPVDEVSYPRRDTCNSGGEV